MWFDIYIYQNFHKAKRIQIKESCFIQVRSCGTKNIKRFLQLHFVVLSTCKETVTIQLHLFFLIKGLCAHTWKYYRLTHTDTHTDTKCPLKFKRETGNYHWRRVLTPLKERWEEMLHWIISANYFLQCIYGICVYVGFVGFTCMCVFDSRIEFVCVLERHHQKPVQTECTQFSPTATLYRKPILTSFEHWITPVLC